MIFGLVFFLSPEIYVDVVAWPFLDPYAGRVMGSLFLGFGVASLLGYKASTWEEVKILVLADIVWGIFVTISMIWMIIVYPSAPILVAGFELILAAFFVVLFLYCYFKANG
jgi:tryptophan-rich sensory protein